MPPIIKLLANDDRQLLAQAADGLFDGPLDPSFTADFLDDPSHHLAVALDDNRIVGLAAAVDYIRPGRPPQLFINAIAVTATHRRQGLATALIEGV